MKEEGTNIRKITGLIAGPAMFFMILYFFHPSGLSDAGKSVLAGTFWVGIWWITEAIPIPATSLLPIIIFPLTGALKITTTTESYGNIMVFLFMGGFMIALSMEKWNLHKRIALTIIHLVGTNTRNIILGFMLSSALLSMWISNTATTMMMFPIALAVARQFGDFFKGEGISSSESEERKFGISLMLGTAYAASIGGIATLIGSPTNVVFSAIAKQYYKTTISFADWIMIGLPIAIILLIICWFYLTRISYKPAVKEFARVSDTIRDELHKLGKTRPEEKKVLVVFVLTAFLWITRSFLLTKIFPGIDDTVVAIFGALILFLIPAGKGDFLLDWKTARKLPWGILLLFGGGLAIANGFSQTDLSAWIGNGLHQFRGANYMVILFIVAITINFMTEITSNVATASIMLPVIASLTAALGFHPYGMMIAAAISSSCAFMLPVATPPNAIVFNSGYIKIHEMARKGFVMNLISVIIIVLSIHYIFPHVWQVPDPVLP